MVWAVDMAVSPIIPSAPVSRHFIFHRICVSFCVIRFHPSHRLFSRLINHSTVSLTIPLGDSVFFGDYFQYYSLSFPDVNKTRKSATWNFKVCSRDLVTDTLNSLKCLLSLKRISAWTAYIFFKNILRSSRKKKQLSFYGGLSKGRTWQKRPSARYCLRLGKIRIGAILNFINLFVQG